MRDCTVRGRMHFGKYEGCLVSWVLLTDPAYALWAHKNVTHFYLSPEEIEACLLRLHPSGAEDHYRLPQHSEGSFPCTTAL